MHSIHYSPYEEDVKRKQVQAEWDEIAWREGDGSGGLPGSINWLDHKIFNSYDEAKNWIENNDKSYWQVAVKYYDYCSLRGTDKKLSKYKELSAKADEAKKKYEELNKTNHFAASKAKYIGCPHCGSKINAEIYNKPIHACNCKHNYCPVCMKDMRPQTTLNKIEAAKVKWSKLEEQAKQEYEKQQKKTKPVIKWLVKTEFHC